MLQDIGKDDDIELVVAQIGAEVHAIQIADQHPLTVGAGLRSRGGIKLHSYYGAIERLPHEAGHITRRTAKF